MPELLEFNLKAKRKPIPGATVGLKLEVGKTYVTNHGYMVKILNKHAMKNWYRGQLFTPSGSDLGKWTWCENGLYQGVITEADPQYERHIVKEFVAEVAAPAPTVSPVAAEPTKHPFLPLEVGKKYVLADGTVVGPLVPTTTTERLRWISPHGAVSWYTSNGKKNGFLNSPEHPRHIVAAYVEPTLTKEEAHLLWLAGVPLVYSTSANFQYWSPFPKDYPIGPESLSFFCWRKA